MPLHFKNLAQHRNYVLHWYRYTLRNSSRYTSSAHLQCRIRRITKNVLKKHKADMSSWSVYILLNEIKELNERLISGDITWVWDKLSSTAKAKKKRKNILEAPSPPSVMTEDPNHIREMNILHQYIKERQKELKLPLNIPNEYKSKLLLPLALHNDSLKKLHRLQIQLAQGPPKIHLNYTSAGRSRIWFIRSALNKGKRQSKALGRLIRMEKKQNQNILNYLDSCQENSVWAWHEAVWEHYLVTGKILRNEQFTSFFHENASKSREILGGTLISTNTPVQSQPPWSNLVEDWLHPIKSAMKILQKKSVERAKYFDQYRRKILMDGHAKFFNQKSNQMYSNRLARYKTMAEQDLPFVTPFFARQNLPSVLKSRKFVK